VDSVPTKAYVLVETAVGKTRDVAAALQQIQGTRSVDIVTGPYDIIAIIEADTLNDVGDMVTSKIRPIPGIARTVTLLAI